jgi:hypothetical protein
MDALAYVSLAPVAMAAVTIRGYRRLDVTLLEKYDECAMDDSRPRNVLVVANRTAATQAPLAEVRRRAAEDPFLVVSAALEAEPHDEIIVSTLPARVSHWLHIDLPAGVGRLGLPVTVVTARKADRPLGVLTPRAG